MSDSTLKEKKVSKTPVYKKWWFWFGIVFLMVSVYPYESKRDESKKVDESPSSNTISTTETEKKKEKNEFAVGDIISYKNREIVVNSVQRGWNSNNEFIQPDEGKEYVKIVLSIENKSDEKMSYNTLDLEIQDDSGDIKGSSWLARDDDDISSGSLAPGGKKTGSVIFEVPKNNNLVLHFKDSWFSDKSVKIKL